MATTFTRMLQRGTTEAEILSSTEVPLAREIITASDTGAFWIGNGTDPASALPKQGPAQPTGVNGIITLPTGEALPTVDQTTSLLPDAVRQAIAEAISDPASPEGAAIAQLIAAAGGGGGALAYDADDSVYSVPPGSTITQDAATGAYSSN